MGDRRSALRGLPRVSGARGHPLAAAVLLALLLAGVVVYGIARGDAGFVAENARSFCFSCILGQ